MKYNDLITPVGTKDYLFTESSVKSSLCNKISNLFKLSGYSEIMTPGVEFYDLFDRKSRYFPQEKMLKFTDTKNRLIVLRPDSTIPIARVVSTRLKEASLPLRLYYDQSVFRSIPELKGRQLETHQIGIEMIGSDTFLSDFEVISTAIEALNLTGENFNIELGSAGIFNEVISKLEVDDSAKEKIRSLIESKNYPALNDFLNLMGNNKVIEILKVLPELFGGKEVFDKAYKIFSNSIIIDILNNIKNLYNKLLDIIPEQNLRIDLAMAHKTDYYTGVMVRGYMDGYGSEVLSGGRYDKLLSEFGYDIPAIGFAINIDAITNIICRRQVYKKTLNSDIIIYCKKGYEFKAFNIAKKYRNKGYICEMSLFDDYVQTINYAKEKKISKIIVVDDSVTESDNGEN